MINILNKCIGLLASFAVAIVLILGMNTGMDMRADGTMSGCMFDQSVTCPMDYGEHARHWQQTFTAVQATQDPLLALVIIAGAAFFTAFLHQLNSNQNKQTILKSVLRQCDIIGKLSNHIIQALSDGRLSPKKYNPIVTG